VLQVNGDLIAKVVYVAQCSVDVRGEERVGHADDVTVADLAGLGLDTAGHDEPDEVLEAYFDALA
jgi:hypothetical protein